MGGNRVGGWAGVAGAPLGVAAAAVAMTGMGGWVAGGIPLPEGGEEERAQMALPNSNTNCQARRGGGVVVRKELQ